MALSKKEIKALIFKLRTRYRDYAERYGSRWFDVEKFEERLRMAEKNKMDMEGFILSEISAFEKLKERYENRKEGPKFSEKVESLVDENRARIVDYPEIEFHPSGDYELTKFYGALAELTRYYLPVFYLILDEAADRSEFSRIEHELERLGLPRGTKPSLRIEEHISVMNRVGAGELEIARSGNSILRDGGLALNDLVAFCDRLLSSRDSRWEVPLRFHQLRISEDRKDRLVENFRDKTGYGAILEVRERAAKILDDFRLMDFRRG
jgi:hypothetical protein